MISLKGFHLFFIVVSILTCAGFGAWGIRDYQLSGRTVHLALGVASCAGGLLLTWYLMRIISTFKRIGPHA